MVSVHHKNLVLYSFDSHNNNVTNKKSLKSTFWQIVDYFVQLYFWLRVGSNLFFTILSSVGASVLQHLYKVTSCNSTWENELVSCQKVYDRGIFLCTLFKNIIFFCISLGKWSPTMHFSGVLSVHSTWPRWLIVWGRGSGEECSGTAHWVSVTAATSLGLD